MSTKLTVTEAYHDKLLRLASGEPVALHLIERNKVIFLIPGAQFGFDENALVVAGLGAKCGIIDLRQINLTPLINAGLSAYAANVLKLELERTYAYANHTIEV